MAIPSYPKVVAVSTPGTERLFEGSVVISEKLDGSLFAWGWVDDEFCCRSHHKQLDLDADNGMFNKAVDTAKLHASSLYKGSIIYCEYFQKPRQNTLSYSRVPKDGLAVFDILQDGTWLRSDSVLEGARELGLETVSILHEGPADLNLARGLIGRQSALGNTCIEGVVIKNYDERWLVGGSVWPIFCKLVDTRFKERNEANWKAESRKSGLDELLNSLATEARWLKAVQHLREKAELQGAVQDIGPLMREASVDFEEEEKAWFCEQVWKVLRKDALRKVTAGLPDWYKQQLAERIVNGQ